MDEKSESAMLERIEKYRNEFHITNRRRIRAGIRCLLIVPLIFLILLLMTGSDRIIFGYLIYLEYMDFKVDKMAADVTGRSFEEMHAVTAAAARDSSSKKDKELDRRIKKADVGDASDGADDAEGKKALSDEKTETQTEDKTDEEHH